MDRKRVFSGIQPTGIIHLGNLIGALKNWVAMQETHDCVYSIVDLHAITVPQKPEALKDAIMRTAAATLAVGVDPARATLFVQSDVPEHTELAWILNGFATFGELSRMTQFKDKTRVRGEGGSAGLLNYPVLMAADILLYDTHAVPVGEDQKQHMELTRELARRINNIHPDLLTVPEPFIGKEGARVMGLDDPAVKMSKTAASDANYIALTDTDDVIRKKLKRAVTDSGSDIRFDEEAKPAISNLLTIFSAATGDPIPAMADRYQGQGYGAFKSDLADAVIALIAPIRERLNTHLSDRPALSRLLEDGAEKARALARPKMQQIRARLGLGR